MIHIIRILTLFYILKFCCKYSIGGCATSKRHKVRAHNLMNTRFFHSAQPISACRATNSAA